MRFNPLDISNNDYRSLIKSGLDPNFWRCLLWTIALPNFHHERSRLATSFHMRSHRSKDPTPPQNTEHRSLKGGTGRPIKIPKWAEKALEKRLQENQGMNSYQEICEWLEKNLGIEANYKTVHKLVYYRLKASPKIARPKSLEQSEERLDNFKKTF